MADETEQEASVEGQTEGQTEGASLTEEARAPAEPPANWRDSLDDDLKGWAEKFESPAAALKSYRELEKRMGRSVTLPGKDATPEEVQAFRKKALGVPDAPTDYKFELPDIAPEEVRADPMSDPLLKEFVETSHANGKSPEQVQADLNLFYKAIAASQEQATAERERALQKADEDLTREWGTDKDANLTFGRRAVKQFDADGQFAEFLNSATVDGVPVGSHPAFVRMFAKIGRALAEDTVQLEPTEAEVQQAESQITKIREQRNDALRRGDRALANKLDQQERDIYARMSGGRAA